MNKLASLASALVVSFIFGGVLVQREGLRSRSMARTHSEISRILLRQLEGIRRTRITSAKASATAAACQAKRKTSALVTCLRGGGLRPCMAQFDDGCQDFSTDLAFGLNSLWVIFLIYVIRNIYFAYTSFWGTPYSLARIKMDGSDRQPMCWGCNRENVKAMLAHDGDYVKHFALANACDLCSLFPSLAGYRNASVRITTTEYGCWGGENSTFLNDGKPVDQAATNRLMGKKATMTPRDVVLFNNFALLNRLQVTKTWCPNRHTGTRTFASGWQGCQRRPVGKRFSESVGETVSGIRTAMNTVVELASKLNLRDRVASLSYLCNRNDGAFPQSLLVSGERGASPLLDGVDELHDEVAMRSVDNPAADPPVDATVTATFGPHAQRIGPILGNPTVWNNKAWQNRVCCVLYRSIPKAKYDRESAAADRLSKLMLLFQQKVFTKAAIVQAHAHVMEHYPDLRARTSEKFSQAEIDAAERRLELTPTYDGTTGQPRTGQVKLEMVAKSGKAARAVIDEGLDLLITNAIVSRILETLVFDKDLGIFYRLSIKHRPRKEVLDLLQEEWAATNARRKGLVAAEVDQTAMELHERYDPVSGGILGPIYSILGTIAQHSDGLPGTELARHMISNISRDAKMGMVVKYRLKEDGGNSFKSLCYEDCFMTSGWRLTSCVNFINELFATMVAFVDDPEKLLVMPRTPKEGGKRFVIQEEDFNFVFKRQLVSDGPLVPVYFRPWVEGDDVLAITSESLVPLQDEIESRYTSMGYVSKVKLVKTGRAEFIGAHFLLQNGVLDSTWIPALARYLCKIGVMASSNLTRESIVARCCSIACMFGGKLPSVANMFYNLGQSHLTGADLDLVIRPKAYSEEERSFGESSMTLREVLRVTKQALLVPHLDMGEQLRLVCGSLESDVSMEELSHFYLLEDRIHKDYPDLEAFGFLPSCLQT